MTPRRPPAPPLWAALLALLGWIAAALTAAQGGWGVPAGIALGLLGLLLLLLATAAARRDRRRLAEAIRAAAAGDAPLSAPAPPELARAVRVVSDNVRSARQLLDQSQSERAQFEHALSAAGDAVLALDSHGRIVYLNPAARDSLAAAEGAPSARIGAPLIEAVADPDLYAAVETARAERVFQSLPIQHGERRYAAAVAPLGEGGVWSVVVALHDLTEQHQAETARRDFFINASHELRTPLSTISAAAETLERARDETAAGRFREIIQVEAERMSQLVEEMLALARLESGLSQPDIQPVAVAPLLERAVQRMRPQAERNGLALSCRSDEAAQTLIEADADLIQRALLNLLQNAIKFTPEGGIEVFAEPEANTQQTNTQQTGTQQAGAQQNGAPPALLWIRVRDSGVGVDPAEQARIFQRFYRIDRARAAGSGTGLGLAVVRHIAEAHGGAVSLESEPGLGSTFGFAVPVAQSTEANSLTAP